MYDAICKYKFVKLIRYLISVLSLYEEKQLFKVVFGAKRGDAPRAYNYINENIKITPAHLWLTLEWRLPHTNPSGLLFDFRTR